MKPAPAVIAERRQVFDLPAKLIARRLAGPGNASNLVSEDGSSGGLQTIFVRMRQSGEGTWSLLDQKTPVRGRKCF